MDRENKCFVIDLVNNYSDPITVYIKSTYPTTSLLKNVRVIYVGPGESWSCNSKDFGGNTSLKDAYSTWIDTEQCGSYLTLFGITEGAHGLCSQSYRLQ